MFTPMRHETPFHSLHYHCIVWSYAFTGTVRSPPSHHRGIRARRDIMPVESVVDNSLVKLRGLKMLRPWSKLVLVQPFAHMGVVAVQVLYFIILRLHLRKYRKFLWS